MLVSGSHSQVLVTELERDGVDIRATHSHPGCRCVSQVVVMKILDADLLAGSPECHRDLIAGCVFEQERLSRSVLQRPPGVYSTVTDRGSGETEPA